MVLKKYTIEDMKLVAAKKGGKCLSKEYVNVKIKLIWLCSNGHRWKATPDKILRGKWCPYCYGRVKLTIDEMKKIAQSRGGKCHSDTYINSKTKLLWECSKGHRWEAAPNNIKTGTWCPTCAGKKKLSIKEMQRIAESYGGKCLSGRYVNERTKLRWECAKGHQWESIPSNVKRGSWCRVCAGMQKLTIEQMREIAEERGGKCVSDIYINNRRKLLWECANGHQWEASPEKVKQGRWCPACATGLGERIARDFFQQIFGKQFPKRYPKWLVNSRGNQMELDGFCSSLKLAFEHHGQQHYRADKQFIKSITQFEQRQRDDITKKELCGKNNVTLIEIPEIPSLLPIQEVKQFIKTECKKKSYPLPGNFNTIEVNLKNAYANSGLKEALKELQIIAEDRGGKCLSETYIHSHRKLLWECAKGHDWKATPTNIKNGNWCPFCVGKAKLTIYDMHKIAKAHGGKCLSESYARSPDKLLWECANGHRWETTSANVRSGNWCPICAGTLKLTIEEMRDIAQKRRGKSLSNIYVSAITKLLWQCSKGHRWEATPGKIKQGKWCPFCAGRRITIKDMQKIARSRGGRCLSPKYINSTTKLLWQCSKGHRWEAIPTNVKRGSWCPKCAKMQKLTIEQMNELAKAKGGKCLSQEYVNSHTKLHWECGEGHQWEAMPYSIKQGAWCPICGRKEAIEKIGL